MSKKPSTEILVAPDRIQQMVRVVRGQRVMLDFDLAQLYGVPTMRLNEQVRRNQERFPEDFAFPLTQQEFTCLMLQILISKIGRGGCRKLPWAFTEHGVAMLSSVLRSPTAVGVNIEISRYDALRRNALPGRSASSERRNRLGVPRGRRASFHCVPTQSVGTRTGRPVEPHRPIGFHVHENA